jgi:hypothetical protein
MLRTLKHNRLVWLAMGLFAGLLLGGMLSDTPLHAVATDRIDTFAMATGPVSDDVEAVFFLDFLTGDLRAVVLGRQGNGFTAFYTYSDVFKDLGVNPNKNPRFLMVTGVADLRRGGGGMQPSRAIVYVAEVTSGKMAAYAIPWSAQMYAQNRPVHAKLMPLAVTPFRPVGGVGAGPVGP